MAKSLPGYCKPCGTEDVVTAVHDIVLVIKARQAAAMEPSTTHEEVHDDVGAEDEVHRGLPPPHRGVVRREEVEADAHLEAR